MKEFKFHSDIETLRHFNVKDNVKWDFYAVKDRIYQNFKGNLKEFSEKVTVLKFILKY